jgi:hypothetical protein
LPTVASGARSAGARVTFMVDSPSFEPAKGSVNPATARYGARLCGRFGASVSAWRG